MITEKFKKLGVVISFRIKYKEAEMLDNKQKIIITINGKQYFLQKAK